jgi:hypothetical protein
MPILPDSLGFHDSVSHLIIFELEVRKFTRFTKR